MVSKTEKLDFLGIVVHCRANRRHRVHFSGHTHLDAQHEGLLVLYRMSNANMNLLFEQRLNKKLFKKHVSFLIKEN